MRSFFTLLVFFLPFTLSAQTINSIQVLPASPTTNDVVRVIVNTSVNTSDCWVSYSSQSSSGYSHDITGYHCSGLLQSICTKNDTFLLGTLPPGTHSVFYQMFAGTLGTGQTNCTAFSMSDTLSYSFYVGTASGSLPAEIHPPGVHEMCEGDSMVYGTDFLPNFTYQWLFNGNAIPGANGLSYAAYEPGYYQVRTYNNGDSGTSMSAQLIVNPLPNTTLEQEGDLIFTSLNVPNYQWGSVQSGTITGETNSSYLVTQNGDYYLQLVSQFNCHGTSDTLYVELIDAELQPEEDQDLCENDSVLLSVLPSDTNHQYLWLRNSQVIAGATSAAYTATDAGTYRSVVSISLSIDTSESVEVTIIPVPIPTVTVSGFTLTSSTAASYQWYGISSGLLTGETNATFTATAADQYYVQIVDANGCVAQSDAVFLDPVGIREWSGAGLHMRVAAHANHVLVSFDEPFEGQLALLDLLGNVISTETYRGKQWRVETSGLASGIYLVKAETAAGTSQVERVWIR